MRRPDIEEGDAAQPLLPESLDDEELAEGRQPSWWEPQNVTIPSSPALSAFANTKSGAGTPNGSRGLESGRQSPKTIGSGATRKSGKGGTRESRARHTFPVFLMIRMTALARLYLDNVTFLVDVMTKAPQKAVFTPVYALQEDAVAGNKLSRDQNVLHVRQARPHIGARP